MNSPYSGLPDRAYWRRSLVGVAPENVDLVDGTQPKFKIGPKSKVATAGSCFAQHVSRAISERGFQYFVTEPGERADNYGVYPARFGNIYTVRQLLQLFERAYHLFDPTDIAWKRDDGNWSDPFRPQIEQTGFRSIEELQSDQIRHFAAVRKMFEEADIFVFTLGLTEGWVSKRDGAVFPLAPGVVASPENMGDYAFENFSVDSMVADLKEFVRKLRIVNPEINIMLTVSPVPLIATYENRHVLVSTIYSKSALRVVAEIVAGSDENIAYFPSYEMITGHHTRYGYFEDDLREVKPEGVAYVMESFARHYLSGKEQDVIRAKPSRPVSINLPPSAADTFIICDEEALDS